ncbi:s-methyl-5-thioribose-1-phosphate isomerase [Latilactobacillus fuchuensis]|uniref:Methylthioribose-1-phosphate isomerase n=1 Tax=Latilactobacillus fuchuensis TaxID=164393 RepID=A0A2N9DWR7_9LACO|nr:s-methyl-5-thioribose-1-phosphate isomerase [Latilactobacillus fuchuensis]SPC39124.1 Methylthioribose-1-phosphate isomerase [Latilactobacillus fuchuensis]
MIRQDEGMPFLLNFENVAWYENGQVRILDRRIFPMEKKFVYCSDYHEIIKAIQEMVTQSAGPYTAVGMGMALAAYQCKDKNQREQIDFLTKAAKELGNARPTTANRYFAITSRTLAKQIEALKNGKSAISAAFDDTLDSLNRRYFTMQKVGNYLVDQFPNNSSILTQCYGETIIGAIIRAAHASNKDLKIFNAETRPFMQGARLTSSCFQEAGFDTTVITDNMTNFVLENGDIDFYTSAADTIAMDGHIANKIGTKQIAILANRVGVPYFVTGIPDQDKKNKDAIKMEFRDPKQVLEFSGIKTTLEGVKAIYPSFDITSPELIGAIVTDKGVFSPYSLEDYKELGGEDFY